MTNLEPPVDDANQDLDTQDLLEWRDLQNAQIDSMMHVWDNPEDECWNDVPLDTPDAYPYLTDAQYDLFDRLSEISEECYCAGWIHDNEYLLWNAITLGTLPSGYGPINPRLLRRCQQLSLEIGGWIYWADGPQFAPMAQWLTMVEIKHKLAAAPSS